MKRTFGAIVMQMYCICKMTIPQPKETRLREGLKQKHQKECRRLLLCVFRHCLVEKKRRRTAEESAGRA